MAERRRIGGMFNPLNWFGGSNVSAPTPNAMAVETTTAPAAMTNEQGYRPTPENRIDYLYRIMWVDPNVRAAILDIRNMDRVDGRVKKIHTRMSRAATKGGLKITFDPKDKVIAARFKDYCKRLGLDKQEKLESDMRGLVMEGNLPLQWVLNKERTQVVAGIRMPSDTILPNVDAQGRFKAAEDAFRQYDIATGVQLAAFGLWQMTLARLTPDNYDDMGAMGRPYLDANRTVWKKLCMTEEDLVLARRERAYLRTLHALEGATPEELEAYKAEIEDKQKDPTNNFYTNRKGSISALAGDTNISQIADVVHLLDTFFAGGPAPKGLFGYADELSRDILDDLKQDYFDELDALQDTASDAYEAGFRLELLLNGLNPDAYVFAVGFAERVTDTRNQRADLGLKYNAMGVPTTMVWETIGIDTERALALRRHEMESTDPYPGQGFDEESAGGPARVSVTPGNRRKGESATDITTRSAGR